jgi:hypothetical protein
VSWPLAGAGDEGVVRPVMGFRQGCCEALAARHCQSGLGVSGRSRRRPASSTLVAGVECDCKSFSIAIEDFMRAIAVREDRSHFISDG